MVVMVVLNKKTKRLTQGGGVMKTRHDIQMRDYASVFREQKRKKVVVEEIPSLA